MVKKHFKVISMFICLTILSFISFEAYASTNNIVDNKKVWEISLKNKIKPADLKRFVINVKDIKGKVVKVTTQLSKTNKSIVINPPINGYEYGNSYILIVNEKVNSKIIKNISTTKFTIKNLDNKVQNKNESKSKSKFIGVGFMSKRSIVAFVEGKLNEDKAQDLSNYVINNNIKVEKAIYDIGANIIMIQTSEMLENKTYNITIKNVTDEEGLLVSKQTFNILKQK